MNELERALLDLESDALDYYLETTSTDKIRDDIQEVKHKAACSTESGVLRLAIQSVLDNLQ